ncbi:MAG: isoprenylcysteine carboxylmethyltransferase family protein [Pseudoxanthomonas sp.]
MSTDATRNDKVPLLVRTLSPTHFTVAMFASFGLQRVLPIPMPPPEMQAHLQAIGTVLAQLGLAMTIVCFAMFAWRRTTFIPERAPSRLVIQGPYRVTRNPMYVSLVLSYVGLAGILLQPWALVLMPLPLLALQRVLIPYEEARLRAEFGDAYDRYCQRVRRWL